MNLRERPFFFQRVRELRDRIGLLVHSEDHKRYSRMLDYAIRCRSLSVLGLLIEKLEIREEAVIYASLLYEADGFYTPINNPIVAEGPELA